MLLNKYTARREKNLQTKKILSWDPRDLKRQEEDHLIGARTKERLYESSIILRTVEKDE